MTRIPWALDAGGDGRRVELGERGQVRRQQRGANPAEIQVYEGGCQQVLSIDAHGDRFPEDISRRSVVQPREGHTFKVVEEDITKDAVAAAPKPGDVAE